MSEHRHTTQIRFNCPTLQPTKGELGPENEREAEEYINPGVFASMLADRVEPVLQQFEPIEFERIVEDHGVHFYSLKGQSPFTIHVVCTNLPDEDNANQHLVFVEPAQKSVRPFPWLRSYPTEPVVPELVNMLKDALSAFDDVTDLQMIPHDQPL